MPQDKRFTVILFVLKLRYNFNFERSALVPTLWFILKQANIFHSTKSFLQVYRIISFLIDLNNGNWLALDFELFYLSCFLFF